MNKIHFMFLMLVPIMAFGMGDMPPETGYVVKECKSSYPEQKATTRTAYLKCVYSGLQHVKDVPPELLEFVAYIVLQSTKVDRGEITKEESVYLIEKKKRELNELSARSSQQHEQTQAAQQQQCINIKKSGLQCTGMYGYRTCEPVSTDADWAEYERVPYSMRCKNFLGQEYALPWVQ